MAKVLATLKAQVPPLSDDRVVLFQDGYKSFNGAHLTNPQLVERSICEFRSAFPRSRLFASEHNLGVALNFNRAEEYVFSNCQAEASLFFEDDLTLSPYYVQVLERLVALALTEPRLAYVSAYGDHRATLEEQRQSPHRLVMMRHKWGFGLTRRQWLKQRSLMKPYLEIICRSDYASRDHQAIRNYYRSLGYGSPGTSQDAMKDVASAVLGTAKIMTFACFGKNIGEIGLHSNSEFYEQERFAATEIFPENIQHFEELSESLLDGCIDEIRRSGLEFLSYG